MYKKTLLSLFAASTFLSGVAIAQESDFAKEILNDAKKTEPKTALGHRTATEAVEQKRNPAEENGAAEEGDDDMPEDDGDGESGEDDSAEDSD